MSIYYAIQDKGVGLAILRREGGRASLGATDLYNVIYGRPLTVTFYYYNNLTRDNLDLKLTWDLEGEKMAVLEALQVHTIHPEYSKHAASGILRMSEYAH